MYYIYIYIYIYIHNTHTHTHTHIYIHTYTMEYYSAIKKEWNNAICSNMDGPRDYHTKQSKPDKDKYHITSLIRGSTKKKKDTNELIFKTDSQTYKTNLWLSKGKGGGKGG